VLKPGGRAAFWDPVKYNPAIEVYRRLAGAMRTEDEHPLRVRDFEAMQARFRHLEARGFWLSALLIFVRFWLVDRIQPSEDRYWKLVIERQDQHARFLRTAHRVDAFLLRWIRPLRWVSWNLAVVCEK
jgi:hypothetical protein